MQVKSFIQTIYDGLTQRGTTMFVSKESIMNFINFGLNDIYSFEGRGWSFMYKPDEEITIPLSETSESYLYTTTYPIFRIATIYDKKYDKFMTNPSFKQVRQNIKNENELFYLPFTTALSIYNNNDNTGQIQNGYTLSYLSWFLPIVSDNDYLPIPDAFTHALYDFVMSYILPVYAQYGEQRENVVYQKGLAKLNELKKADDIQFSKISFNIK